MSNNNKRWTHEQFVSTVQLLVGDEYSVIGQYKNSKQDIKMLHNVCGKTFFVRPGNFVHHERRCLECKASKKTKMMPVAKNIEQIQKVQENQETNQSLKMEKTLLSANLFGRTLNVTLQDIESAEVMETKLSIPGILSDQEIAVGLIQRCIDMPKQQQEQLAEEIIEYVKFRAKQLEREAA